MRLPWFYICCLFFHKPAYIASSLNPRKSRRVLFENHFKPLPPDSPLLAISKFSDDKTHPLTCLCRATFLRCWRRYLCCSTGFPGTRRYVIRPLASTPPPPRYCSQSGSLPRFQNSPNRLSRQARYCCLCATPGLLSISSPPSPGPLDIINCGRSLCATSMRLTMTRSSSGVERAPGRWRLCTVVRMGLRK